MGLFIVVDGPDACGKTTLIKGLVRCLQAANIPYVTTKEPNSPSSLFEDKFSLGQEVHALVSNNQSLGDTTRMLLMYAARIENYTKVILPALNARKVVITDRWSSSSEVYQISLSKGTKRQIRGLKRLQKRLEKSLYSYHDDAGISRIPDISVILSTTPIEALHRLGIRSNDKNTDKDKNSNTLSPDKTVSDTLDGIERYTFENTLESFITGYTEANQAYARIAKRLRLCGHICLEADTTFIADAVAPVRVETQINHIIAVQIVRGCIRQNIE